MGVRELRLIRSAHPPLGFGNLNGGDIFIFPGFVAVTGERSGTIGLIEWKDVTVSFEQKKFVEQEQIPPDTRVVDHTWAKANKDGSRDKRFKHNHRLPVVLYGELTLRSPNGLHEVFTFSNPDTSRAFADALQSYQRAFEQPSAVD